MRLFVDAYGLEDRSALLPTLRSRLVFVGELVARQAAVGDVGMQRLVSMSVPKKMFEDDVGFLDRNWRAIERVL